jgi:hypothetical protein
MDRILAAPHALRQAAFYSSEQRHKEVPMMCLKEAPLGLLVLATLVVVAGPAFGETLFTAVIDASQCAPPTDSSATGYASLILNDAQTAVDYAITYENLEGTETDAHFHNAPPGESGLIVYFLPLGSPKIGTWELTAHDVGDLFAGTIYVNIHTDLYISGEIRGDISEDSTGFLEEPGQRTWTRIKALYR